MMNASAEIFLKERLLDAGLPVRLTYPTGEARRILRISRTAFYRLILKYREDPRTGQPECPYSLKAEKCPEYQISYSELIAFIIRNRWDVKTWNAKVESAPASRRTNIAEVVIEDLAFAPAAGGCPFCSGLDIRAVKSQTSDSWALQCIRCSGVGPPASTLGKAVLRWNAGFSGGCK